MKNCLIILLSFLFLEGCDLFITREAESPLTQRDTFQLAITPDLLIDNFKNSYKDKNIQNYLACFSDSSFSDKIFVYHPSSVDFPFPDEWLKKDEEQYFNNLRSKVPKDIPVTVSFFNENSIQQGDSMTYTASYSVSVPFEDSSIPGYYEGEVKFILSIDSRLIWVITSWWDTKNSSTKSLTWSDLKGRLY